MQDTPLKKKKKFMKKISDKKSSNSMKNEYNFDYSKAKPNRFANIVKEKVVLYPIDKDVAEVFQNPVQVNNALRASINAVPSKTSKRKIKS